MRGEIGNNNQYECSLDTYVHVCIRNKKSLTVKKSNYCK